MCILPVIHSLYDAAGTKHMFNARESEWGYLFFMPLDELYEPSMGYLVNDTVVIEAEVVFSAINIKYCTLFEHFLIGISNTYRPLDDLR